MARDLILDVVARKNSKDLSTLADEFDRLAKQTDDFGAKLNKTTTFSKYLDDELEKTKVKVRELGDEFQRTGDKDVFAKLRGAQSNVKSLEGIKKQLTDALNAAADDAGKGSGGKGGFWNRVLNLGGSTMPNASIKMLEADGLKAGQAFDQGFVGALGDIATTAAPVLAPMAAGLVALIGASVGGAALAGAAGLGLGAAIVAQLHDPAIKTEATDLVSWLGTQFEYASKAVGPELMAGFGDLKTELGPVFSQLGETFKVLAPYVATFAHFLGQAAQQFMPGFSRALIAAGPVLGVISRELPTLANAANIFFDEVNKGSKGGAEAIDTLIKGFSMLIAGLGFAIRFAENLWDVFVQALDKGTGILAKIPGLGEAFKPFHEYVHGIATSFDNAQNSSSNFAGGLDNATVSADSLGSALGTVNRDLGVFVDLTQQNKNIDLATAVIGVTDAVKGLSDSLRQNGNSFDINTAKGAANTQMYIDGVAKAKAHAQALLDSGAAAADAAKAYQTDIDKLDAATRAGGATTQTIHDLDSAYSQADHFYDFTIRTKFITEGTPSSFYHGLAHGGSVPGYAFGGGVIKVGEMGPEYLNLPPTNGPAYVTPNSAINGAANSQGGASRVIVDFAGTARGGSLDAVLETWFMERVRAGRIKVSLSQLAA